MVNDVHVKARAITTGQGDLKELMKTGKCRTDDAKKILDLNWKYQHDTLS
jgi:hypothetical protein